MLISILVISLMDLALAQEQRGPMDLAAIIQEALENNAGVAASKTKVEVAEAGRSAAVKQRLPRLDLFTSYESFPVEDKLLLPRHMDIPTPPFTQEEMVDFFQNQFNTSIFNGGINLKLPVYTGGRIGAGIKIQEAMIYQAELSLESNLNNLVFSISKSYYMALQLQKVIEANEKAVQSLAESKRIVGQLLDAGKARNVDVLRINTKLAAIEQNLIKARFNLERTHGLLNSLMGRNITADLQVIGVLQASVVEFTLEESIDQALRANPEYLSLQSQMAAQHQKVRMVKSGRLPNLALMGFYKRAAGDISTVPRNDAAIVANLSIPLFNGGLIRTKIKREQMVLRVLEEKQRALRQKLSQEVYSAYLDINEAEQRIEVAELAILAAEEGLRIEKLRLEQGIGVVRDVLDTQVDQLKAEVNHYRALSDYNVSVLLLQKTVGTLSDQRFDR